MNVRTTSRLIAATLTLAFIASTAHAHEFWLTASKWAPALNEPVEVTLHVGEFFAGDLVGVTASHAASLRVLSRKGAEDLTSRVPRSTMLAAIRLAFARPGTQVLVYDSHPSELTLSADKFHAYLHEEGLDATIRQRETAGTAAKEGRERFRRNAKLLLRAGGASDETYAEPTGQRLQILPQTDPLRARPGDRLTFTLLFEGKALPGALLKAWHKQGGQVTVLRSVSDHRGQVTVQLPFVGPWLMNVVHMVPADAVPGIDWESYWSSLTSQLTDRK